MLNNRGVGSIVIAKRGLPVQLENVKCMAVLGEIPHNQTSLGICCLLSNSVVTVEKLCVSSVVESLNQFSTMLIITYFAFNLKQANDRVHILIFIKLRSHHMVSGENIPQISGIFFAKNNFTLI